MFFIGSVETVIASPSLLVDDGASPVKSLMSSSEDTKEDVISFLNAAHSSGQEGAPCRVRAEHSFLIIYFTYYH